ncbi:hypothetical protein JHW43_005833 [Diplocarpon mali]|nr:hypothetical protein JHW43_005833 [Diplocarpon mali]
MSMLIGEISSPSAMFMLIGEISSPSTPAAQPSSTSQQGRTRAEEDLENMDDPCFQDSRQGRMGTGLGWAIRLTVLEDCELDFNGAVHRSTPRVSA